MLARRFSHPSVEALTTGFTYFVSAALAIRLTRFEGGVAFVWIAGAILFAKLSVTPRRRWGGIITAAAIGSGAASSLFGFGGFSAIPMSLTTVVEAVAATILVRRAYPRFGRFESLGEVGWFIAVAGVLIPAVSAFAGAGCAYYAVHVPFWHNWLGWFAAHALGFVAFAPPALFVCRGDVRRWAMTPGRRTRAEAAILLAAVMAASFATFAQNEIPLVAIPFLPMIAATFRLGRFGAASSIILLMCVGIPCSMLGLGPTSLLHTSLGVKLQVLQIYFATVVLVLLPVAAELKTRKRLYARLEAAETLQRLILDRTGDLVIRIGLDGAIRYLPRSIASETADEEDRRPAKPLAVVVCREDQAIVTDAVKRAVLAPAETIITEFRVENDAGEPAWVECHVRANIDPAGNALGAVAILREISARRRLFDELTLEANTDALTGLYNRRAFNSALNDCIEKRSEFESCLALFDLDHFKQVNDQHGHAAGDAVLIVMSEVLRASVREGDVVARLGGEEFGALLQGASVEQAQAVCDRIRSRLSSAALRSSTGQSFRVTVSGGIADVGGHPNGNAVLAAADGALYRAKEKGRDRLVIAA